MDKKDIEYSGKMDILDDVEGLEGILAELKNRVLVMGGYSDKANVEWIDRAGKYWAEDVRYTGDRIVTAIKMLRLAILERMEQMGEA